MKQKLYILHGWAYDTKRWQPFLETLTQAGIEIVLLSVPGLTAPLETAWSLADYVEWLHTQLSKERSPIVLLGHSNGGRIGLAYALRYPEKLKQLILIDSAGIYHNGLSIRIKRYVFRLLANVGKRFSQSERLRALLYRAARESDYRKANPVLRKTMRNLILVDLTPQLAQITVPTIIVWGADDTVTPLGDAEIMQREIPRAVLHIIEGAKHSPQFTHMEEVAGIIVDALT